jgi:hypothetical protein
MQKLEYVIVSLAVCVLAVAVLGWKGNAQPPSSPAVVDESDGVHAAAPATTSGSDTPGTISVTGDAEVRVVPDEVILTLGVETWHQSLNRAKRENDQRVAEVTALARAHGIPAEHIQTDHISIQPRYENNYEKDQFIGFFVRRTVVLTLRDLTRFEDLLTGALESGASHVHGIQFRTTELRAHKDEARSLAVVAAREKAAAMASDLGQVIGAPRQVREVQIGWWSPYSSWWGGGWGQNVAQNVIQEVGGGNAAGGDGTLSPGQISVRAQVSVTFEMHSAE